MKEKVFADILKYELRKLFFNKLTILMIIMVMTFLFGITMLEYQIISPEDKYVSQREAALEGRLIDDGLIHEVVDEAESARSFAAVPGSSQYCHIAAYMNRAMGEYMSIDGITGDYTLEDIAEESFYQTRTDILDYLYDFFGLSQEEREFWMKKESEVDKPFVWQANYGISSMRANYGTLAALASMILGICVAGVFAAERRYKTEDIIVCTKEGKYRLRTAKLIAGELFSLTVGILLLFAVQIPHIIYNGLDGINADCQIIVPFTSYPYSAGKLLLILTGIYFLAVLMIGTVAMLLSYAIKNVVATAGIICFCVVADVFLAIPARIRMLSQIRCLTPVQVLSNASMTDPRLVKLGGIFLTSYQTAAGIFILLTLICAACVLMRSENFNKA